MLKHLMIPFAAGAAMLAGAAFAETSTGAILEISDEQDKVTLENGEVFQFDPNTDLSGFLAGNVVTDEWTPNGDQMEGDVITAVEGSNVITGEVTGMGANTLTIDGKVYVFASGVDLSGIAEGDRVRVTFLDQAEPQGLAVFIPAS